MKKLCLLLTLLIPILTFSQIINIPADYPSIQQGINAAEEGATILVQPGTYIEKINYYGKDIIVASQFLMTQDTSFISQTIIDGNQNGGSVVKFENGESQSAFLIGFTITNGHSNSSGGGISCVYGSEPQLQNLIITENSAQYNGGGIICGANASPSITDVLISNNSAGGDGGGIFCFNYCNPSLINVTITGNSSTYHGGGICCLQNSSPMLENVTLSNNSAPDGGGIYGAGNANFNLINVTIDGNTATEGGGIFMSDNTPMFSQVVISNNSASRGGGIFSENLAMVDLQQSTIRNNFATNKGAGIYSFNARLFIDNCSITENEISGGQGGAIYFNCGGEPIELPEVSISNTVISDNIGTANGSSVGVSSGAVFLKPEEFPPFDIYITNCTFEGNTSKSNTALRITGYDLGFEIINCSFLSNEAEQYSAGLGLTSGCAGEVINCLFASNTANTIGEEWNSGGAALWNNVDASFINCTFVGNSAFYGSAMAFFTSEALMLNCIVFDNDNDQITLLDGEEIGSTLHVGYSDIQDGESGISVGELSELTWSDGNIDQDPLFLGMWEHHFQLMDNSPCIDAGSLDTSGLNLPEYDLAGEDRIFNDRIDMGAYEWNTFVGVDDLIDRTSNLKVQTYPNPFATSTTIEYELTQPSTVQITIFNHLGKQVELIEQNQSAGKQQFVWNAERLPGGIYFCVLKTESGIQTVKMIKLK